MGRATQDANFKSTIIGVDSIAFVTPTEVAVNASTHAMLVETTSSSTDQDVNLVAVGGSSFSLGQQLAASSLPVVLTASQLSTLTPLSTVAVTQSTSPWVVSLASTTITGTVAVTQSTSPWVISGSVTANAGTNLNTSLLALESGGNLATLAGGVTSSVYQENLKQVNGATVNVGTGTASTGTQRVAVASDSSIVLAAGSAVIGHVITDSGSVTTATLSAETTKVIGTVNQGTSPWVTTATLQTQTDTVMVGGVNIKEINAVTPLMGNGTTGTGSLRVTIASDNTAFSVNSTLSAETTKVIGVVRTADGSGNLLTSTSNALDVNLKSGAGSSPGTLVAFVTTVTTAGTRVQLASNSIVGVVLEAPSTNTGKIYVGGSTVSSTVFGAELQPGQSVGIAVNNTNLIYIDSSVNGDKCAVIGS